MKMYIFARTLYSADVNDIFLPLRFHIFNCKLDVMKTDVEDKEQLQLKVRGPCCACRCCTQMQFDVSTGALLRMSKLHTDAV